MPPKAKSGSRRGSRGDNSGRDNQRASREPQYTDEEWQRWQWQQAQLQQNARRTQSSASSASSAAPAAKSKAKAASTPTQQPQPGGSKVAGDGIQRPSARPPQRAPVAASPVAGTVQLDLASLIGEAPRDQAADRKSQVTGAVMAADLERTFTAEPSEPVHYQLDGQDGLSEERISGRTAASKDSDVRDLEAGLGDTAASPLECPPRPPEETPVSTAPARRAPEGADELHSGALSMTATRGAAETPEKLGEDEQAVRRSWVASRELGAMSASSTAAITGSPPRTRSADAVRSRAVVPEVTPVAANGSGMRKAASFGSSLEREAVPLAAVRSIKVRQPSSTPLSTKFKIGGSLCLLTAAALWLTYALGGFTAAVLGTGAIAAIIIAAAVPAAITLTVAGGLGLFVGGYLARRSEQRSVRLLDDAAAADAEASSSTSSRMDL